MNLDKIKVADMNLQRLRVHRPEATHGRACDRKSHLSKLGKGLDETQTRGQTVVSMKAAWKTRFPHGSK